MTERGAITGIEWGSDGAAVTYDGWTLFISSQEFNGLSPKIGDIMVTGPSIGRPIQYIEIDGHVIRDVSDDEQAEKHKEMVAGFRRRRIAEYEEHGDEWKATAQGLLPPLAARIQRFEDDNVEFWIEDGGYELYALKAADALARHVMSVYPGDTDKQIEWIEWWDSLNSKEHDYDYKRQMAILPEFGDGHSGNTHGAGVFYAKRVVRGDEC